MRIKLWWDVPEKNIQAMCDEMEEVAKKHGGSMPDFWQEQWDIQLWRDEMRSPDGDV